VRRYDLITFLTDFGWSGGYVAACEATLASLRPEARVMHISHEVGVGDILEGATVLARVAPLCPVAVHLAVVDPGVGTDRRPLALLSRRGDLLIGPDNGLLVPALEALGGASEAWVLDQDRVRARAGLSEDHLSFTFHGRDLFAPAAALLSSGIPAGEFSAPVRLASLVPPSAPVAGIDRTALNAEVIEVDRFGNIGLALRFDDFRAATSRVDVEVLGEAVPHWSARLVRTYGELAPGELGLYRDSWGQVALALNGASAAQVLGVRRGMSIRISPAHESPPTDVPGSLGRTAAEGDAATGLQPSSPPDP
jgi:S-adenosylmethionine hydrolase